MHVKNVGGSVSGAVSGSGTDGKKVRKNRELHFRLTADELDALEMASYATEKSKSDILRKGLKMYLSTINDAF
jgi:hypothetical protein